jgi:hypothetical protein
VARERLHRGEGPNFTFFKSTVLHESLVNRLKKGQPGLYPALISASHGFIRIDLIGESGFWLPRRALPGNSGNRDFRENISIGIPFISLCIHYNINDDKYQHLLRYGC